MKRILALLTVIFILCAFLTGLSGCSGKTEQPPSSEVTEKEPSSEQEQPSEAEEEPQEKEPVHRVLYISPDGNDEGDGSEASPFATIEKAKSVLKKEKPDSAEVILEGGTYFIDTPVSFKGGDCANVTYRSAEGEKAVLSGGVSLRGKWDGTAQINGNTVWVKKFGSVPGSGEFNALYGEDGFLTNARYPDEGEYLRAEDGGRATKPDDDLYAGNFSLFVDKNDIPDLSEEDLTHSYLRIYHYWTEETLPLTGYDEVAGEFVFKDAAQITVSKDDCYCLENVRCGLDEPGEWYFDYGECTLYYYPKDGETQDGTEIVYPVTDSLMTLQSAKNLRFENLTFRDAGWHYEILCSQSAQNADACILLTSCTDVTFADCDFCCIGQSCLYFGNYTGYVNNCSVSGCTFTDIGMQAVVIGGDNISYSTADGISVTDCYITRYGQARRSAAGILMTFGKNCTISHNEICYGGYTGISVGWVWGYEPSVNENNRICDNLIYHIGHIPLSDMGGIYVLGVQPDSVISGNVITDVKAGEGASTYGGWGIYLDEGSKEFSIYNNLVYGCDSQGFHQGNGRENKVYNNIFALNEDGQVRVSNSADGFPQIYLTGNILVGKSQLIYQYPVKNRFSDDGNLCYDYDLLTEVVSGNEPDVTDQKNLTVAEAEKRGYYSNAVFADPGFVDAEGYNFTFADLSAATEIGFTPYDFSSVGSAKYGSGLLVNTLTSPLSLYPSEEVQAYREAKEAFLLDRTDETLSAFRLACEHLHAFDGYTDITVSADGLYGGEKAEQYREAMASFRKLLFDGNSDSTALSSAAEACKKLAEEIRSSSLTLKLDYGTKTETFSLSYGEETVLPSPEKDGFLFAGWRKDDGTVLKGGEKAVGGCGEVTLTALWENAHTLELGAETLTLRAGERILLSCPEKEGYLFLGWNKDGTERMKGYFTMPDEDVVLKADYAEKGILRFDSWQTAGKNEAAYAVGEPVGTLPVLTKLHSIFLGWNTEKDGTGTTFTEETLMPSGYLTLYPVWAESHMLLFNNEFDMETAGGFQPGYNCSDPVMDYDLGTVTYTVLGDNAYLNISPVRLDLLPGHTYQIFYTYTVNGEISENTRMTVMPYDINNEWGSNVYIENLPSGEFFTVDDTYHYIALRPGSTIEESGSVACYSDIYLIDISDENGSLYDISLPNLNGETQLSRLAASDEKIGALPVMEKAGATFVGWNTAKDGTGVFYTEDTLMPKRNVHLWAIWE